MSLISPSAIERDNQNALRKYPFADAAACGNGSVAIPAGAIIDAQIYALGRTPGRVWVSRIDTDGKLHLSDTAGEFAETTSPVQPETAVPVTYTATGGPLPGGVVVCGKEEDVATLLRACGQEFDVTMTELAPSAVTFLGLPGVMGFLLDDGSVVSGHVRFRGENGCRVSAWADNAEVGHLRISAMGAEVDTEPTSGFITHIHVESNNASFVVSENEFSTHVVDITGCGAAFALAAKKDGAGTSFEFAGRDETCEQVKKIRGTTPNPTALPGPDCDVCALPGSVYKLHLMVGSHEVATLDKTQGAELGTAPLPGAALIPEGKRFAGYYEVTGSGSAVAYTLYYRADGSGAGRFHKNNDVDLQALFMPGSSKADVTFDSYGTLHLSAPDIPMVYSNPVSISGVANPVPSVAETHDAAVTDGGAEVLADLVLHPNVPDGSVVLGIRGLKKAYTT